MWKDITGKYDERWALEHETKPLAIVGDPDGECLLIAIDGGATLCKGTLAECKAAAENY